MYKSIDELIKEREQQRQRLDEVKNTDKWAYRRKVPFSVATDIDKFLYYLDVWFETEIHTPNIDGNEKRGKDYSLDHIIPISYGYKNNICPSIIGGIKNLRVISTIENIKKNTKLTEEALELLAEIGHVVN